MACCGKTFTCLFIFFNIIFSLVGLATIGFGIYMKVSPGAAELQKLFELAKDMPYLGHVGYIIIGFGAFVFLLTLCGIAGACSRNRLLLGIYIFFSIAIVIGEIAALVLTVMVVVQAAPIDSLGKEFQKILQEEYRPGRTKYTQPWDHIQVWFSCCGVFNHTDYNSDMTGRDMPVPVTCCKLKGDKDPNDPLPENKDLCKSEASNNIEKPKFLNSEGCFSKLQATLMQYSTVLLIVECVIVVITIIGIIIAACLCRREKSEKIV